MTEELQDIIEKLRANGVYISDEEAEYVLRYCNRKMNVAKVKDTEEYLPLLFADELKNFLFRQYVNATTMLRKAKVEVEMR